MSLVKRLRATAKMHDAGCGDVYPVKIPVCVEAAARIEALEAENAELKCSIIAFGALWAGQYAKDWGLPPGHLNATHYDILQRAGARMDDFTRNDAKGAI